MKIHLSSTKLAHIVTGENSTKCKSNMYIGDEITIEQAISADLCKKCFPRKVITLLLIDAAESDPLGNQAGLYNIYEHYITKAIKPVRFIDWLNNKGL